MQWWVEATDIARNVGLFVGGAFGLYLGWKRVTVANRQAEAQTRLAELTRRGHVAELVNRSIGQLGDEKLEIRLGSIFALKQICHDFPDWSEPIVQLLTIYLKENPVDYGDAEPPADVREVIRLVQSQAGI
jgi:hypothetical protein